MHQPEAVQFVVKRSRWLARLLLALWLCGVLSLLTFFQTQVASAGVVWISVFAMLLASGLACHIGLGMAVGILRWDGATWYWSGFEGDEPCSVTLYMDFQQLLIVSVRRQGIRPVWLWLEYVPGMREWLRLRRAVVTATARHSARNVSDTRASDHTIP